MKHAAIMIAVLIAILSSTPSQAEPYRRYWVDPYASDDLMTRNRYHPGVKGNDYTINSTTTDSAGNPINMRTKVERSRDEYSRHTTITGPQGLISDRKDEIKYGSSKIRRTTTITNPDGSVDVRTQRYKLDD